jgi:hypothetical protein
MLDRKAERDKERSKKRRRQRYDDDLRDDNKLVSAICKELHLHTFEHTKEALNAFTANCLHRNGIRLGTQKRRSIRYNVRIRAPVDYRSVSVS